ncbi:hypothetical protein ciss_00680 [Carboxydothermus islandicus]|uniref:Uncharacterized protein n=1 Tax=Carboxydothermus islandicus TaxID=661089 RepID=A0A1L8CYX7_9THEO|nr:hypothetical protein [Carboxydothermus islandicus]GAV24135.1 hypothetical protein ciss_00680 [Carboxydothermus islandicus]
MSVIGGSKWFLFLILILLIFGLNDRYSEQETYSTVEKEVV